MPYKKGKLQVGGAVRVRDLEGEVRGQYTMPSDGSPLVIRDLAPGRYVAADEVGGERLFVVTGDVEQVELGPEAPDFKLTMPKDPVPGEASAETVRDGGGRVVRASAGPTREFHKAQRKAEAKAEAAGWRN